MPPKLAGPIKHVEQLGSYFAVEITGLTLGYFTDISGLSHDVGVVDVQVTNSKGDVITKKVMGTPTYGDITLKRPLSKDKTFYDWAQKVLKGDLDIRKDGAIVFFSSDNKESGRWSFTMGFPKKWSASDLDVGTDDLMVEEVTLVIEGIKRVK